MPINPPNGQPRRLHWKRPRLETENPKKAGMLTPEEAACTVGALNYLCFRYGSVAALAVKMGIERTVLRRAMKGAGPPLVTITLEVARVAGVTVNDVLQGRYPAGECPMCGKAG